MSLYFHNHKKRKDSLETRTVLTEVFMLCWNLPRAPQHREWLQKALLFLKGISCLQVILMLIWIKQKLIWFNLQRDGTGNGLSNIKDNFAESLQLATDNISSAPRYEHLPFFKAFTQVHMMAGQNVKRKYLMCQIAIKMLRQHAIPNSSLHNLKI